MSNTLLPVDPQILIDQDYLLSAMGLLSQNYPEAALNILKKKLYRLNP
ncbi:glutamate mutase L [Enterococcus gallinarum]|nr:glutamate mutase L [Enterococcus sp. FDAARGOS_553]MCU7700034.1 glutamate mutase L [Enterococcus gallinarum]MCW3744677.1 glutamate mutase L [Enterococcus gallinarum]